MLASLRAHDVSWETPDGRPILRGLDLHLTAGSHALVGPNGIGKTTLLEVLAGLRAPTRGSVECSGLVGYLPQNRSTHDEQPMGDALGVRSRLSALDRIEQGAGTEADFTLVGDDWDLSERAGAVLGQLALPSDLDRPMGTLSGGQQSRVWLGQLLLKQPDFLLLDEPTNHLDRQGREALALALDSFKGGLLVASHDRWLLRRQRRIVSLEPKGLRIFECDYDSWRQARDAERQAAAEAYAVADQEAQRAKRMARWLLSRFRFRDDDVHKPIRVLSGGECMRAALAVALHSGEPPQLLVLDEPTNNLDLDSRLDLESALQAYRGALLVISHDDALLDALQIDRVIRL
jgi:ATPase subunit of ABC transporter with duplicated ATPase domains